MDLATASPTTDRGWQSRAGREITLSEAEYVSGLLALGWPDGDWPIKLPNAEMTTVEVKNGITGDLAVFVWNALSPSARVSVQPPREHSPGVLSLESRPRVATQAPQPPKVVPRDDIDHPIEISLRVIRQAVDRLEPPVQFEHVWALLNDLGVELPPGQAIALIRQLFHVDNSGVVRRYEDEQVQSLSFRSDTYEWDNIEQAYWELHDFEEPPYLERVYRRRKSSIYDGLEYHLDEIRHRLLTPAQEEDLGTTIQQGQEAAKELRLGVSDFDSKNRLGLAIRAADEAREQFETQNLRLVLNIAKKYVGQAENTTLSLGDLIQAGYLGLLRAVEKFDPDKGFKFSTYATWWIKQSISRQIADRGRIIRLPVHMHDKLQSYRRHHERLQWALGRAPSPKEVSEASGLSPTEIEAVRAIHEITPLPDEEELASELASIDDTPLQELIRQDTTAVIRSTLSALDDRTARMLTLRFGLDGRGPRTLEEIGREVGVTRERVRQLEKKALANLAKRAQIRQLMSDSRADDLASWPPSMTEDQALAWEQVRVRAKVIEALNRE